MNVTVNMYKYMTLIFNDWIQASVLKTAILK